MKIRKRRGKRKTIMTLVKKENMQIRKLARKKLSRKYEKEKNTEKKENDKEETMKLTSNDDKINGGNTSMMRRTRRRLYVKSNDR